jgi:predicted ATPase
VVLAAGFIPLTIGKRETERVATSLFKTTKSAVEEPLLSIEKQEEEILKLVTLVTNEVQGAQLDQIIKLIQESVASPHASNEDKQNPLATWVNGIVTGETYSTVIKSRKKGTSDWALELSEFQAWASDESTGPRLLWMHGPPGFGKTFMSGWIIHYLKEKKQTPLAFFFCVADTQATRDPYAILRSWLTQMLGQDERILAAMMTIHRDQREEQSLTHAVLWDLFSAVGGG